MFPAIGIYLNHFIVTFPYRDCTEVLFFSALFYYTLLWLRKDTEKNLVLLFYSYWVLFFGVHYFDLQVIRFLLFVSSPLVVLLFVIFHQETLQKNFVRLSKGDILPAKEIHWADELIKCCLSALNKRKEVLIVIERNDALKSLIHAPYFIYAELKKDLFEILLEKHRAGNDSMIWINQQGKLVAINSFWRIQLDDLWLSKEVEAMHAWKQRALFITSKTDVLIFKVNPLTRSFDLIVQGTITEGMNAEQAVALMKKKVVGCPQKEKATAPREEQPPSEKTL